MKLEELYNEWKSLFPLLEKQTQLLRKKGYVDRRNDGSWHVLALNSRTE